jgi:hypothetical protein
MNHITRLIPLKISLLFPFHLLSHTIHLEKEKVRCGCSAEERSRLLLVLLARLGFGCFTRGCKLRVL